MKSERHRNLRMRRRAYGSARLVSSNASLKRKRRATSERRADERAWRKSDRRAGEGLMLMMWSMVVSFLWTHLLSRKASAGRTQFANKTRNCRHRFAPGFFFVPLANRGAPEPSNPSLKRKRRATSPPGATSPRRPKSPPRATSPRRPTFAPRAPVHTTA